MSKVALAQDRTRWWNDGLLLMLLVAAMLALGACNTMRGAGEDVQAAGEAMSGAAEETEEEVEEEM